jgi:hypothetical protein
MEADGCGQSTQFHLAMACLNPDIHFQWLKSGGGVIEIKDDGNIGEEKEKKARGRKPKTEKK